MRTCRTTSLRLRSTSRTSRKAFRSRRFRRRRLSARSPDIRVRCRGSVAGVVTTAFGKAEIAEQVTLKQRVNGKQFSTLVQLLEDDKGGGSIRFAYATDGVARRGPVTLRGSDVERLRVALKKTPRLQALLGMGE